MSPYFEKSILQKHANLMGSIKKFITNTKPYQKYKATKESPSFKIKSGLGKGILATTGLGWGLSKLSKPPELVQNSVPGIPPRMQ